MTDHGVFLSDISKLASNTSFFSFVVGLDGMKDLSHEETLPSTHSFLASMADEEPQDNFAEIGDEILQAALARTIATSVIEAQAYRVSGSGPSSSKPKAKNRARKEVTQLEQRQYRHQFLEAKMSEHKSWVDNNVYDLVDMSKHPPKIGRAFV